MLLLFSEEKNHIDFAFKLDKGETFSLLQGKVKGLAVPYNQKTDDWRKISFRKGAFKNLKGTSVYVNHASYDVRSMVGKTEYTDSTKGVLFDAALNIKDTLVSEKLIPLIEMGALDGVSIGAKIIRRETKLDDDGDIEEIIIIEAEITELSFVTMQAFQDALIQANKKEINMNEKEKLEAEKLAKEAKAKEAAEKLAKEEAEDAAEEKLAKEAEAKLAAEKLAKEGNMTSEDFKKELAAKDAEIAKLKQSSNDKGKKNLVQKLIETGIVHKSHEERILKSFASAEAIDEFYKDIPASFSVGPKGHGQSDVTADQIADELAASVASETSLKKEDIQKYGQNKE